MEPDPEYHQRGSLGTGETASSSSSWTDAAFDVYFSAVVLFHTA